jgi:hypothetical protein
MPSRYVPSPICRRAAHHRATVAAGIPEYASDIRPVRGRCRHGRCKSRWAVLRVSLDFRDPVRVDRLATTECALCGRVWRRVKVPRLTSPDGYQEVRLTLILPGTYARWYSRGRWHREGDDAVVLRDASIADLDEAARAHRAKSDALASRKAAALVKAQADAAATHERTMDLLARLAAMDAARTQEETEASTRD